MRTDERAGHPTWSQVEELETKAGKSADKIAELADELETALGERDRYNNALDEIAKAMDNADSPELAWVHVCRILKDAGK